MTNVSLSLRQAVASPLAAPVGQYSDASHYSRFDIKYGVAGLYYSNSSIDTLSGVVFDRRASSFSVTNTDDSLTVVGSGEISRGTQGLEVYDAATNLLSGLSYAILANGSGTVTVTENAGLAPDGTMTAMRLDFSPSTSGTSGIRYATTGLTNPTALAPSLYVKRLSGDDQIRLRKGDGNLGTEVLPITDEWTRISPDAGTNAATYFNFDITKFGVYPEMSCLVWGHQLEEGFAVTPYTPDTRAASEPTLVQGYGPERIADGGFDNGLSDWSQGSGSFYWSVIDGKATKPAGDAIPLHQNAGLSEDQAEWLKADVVVNAGTLTIRGGGQSVGRIVSSTESIDELFIPAPGSNPSLVFSPSSDFEGSVDNVSIKQVLPFAGYSGTEQTVSIAWDAAGVTGDRTVWETRKDANDRLTLHFVSGALRLESCVGGVSQGFVSVAGVDDGGDHAAIIYWDEVSKELSIRVDSGAAVSATVTSIPTNLNTFAFYSDGAPRLNGRNLEHAAANGDLKDVW